MGEGMRNKQEQNNADIRACICRPQILRLKLAPQSYLDSVSVGLQIILTKINSWGPLVLIQAPKSMFVHDTWCLP